jgi:hypothetical protein
MPSSAPVSVAYDASTSEAEALAFWLGTKRTPGFVQTHRGIGWHIRLGWRQNVTGFPDVLMLLPMPDLSTLLVALEIKIGDDRLRPAQRAALHRFSHVPQTVSGVVRYGRPRVDEWTQDEAVAIIEAALAA